jgi:hypothetical protein
MGGKIIGSIPCDVCPIISTVVITPQGMGHAISACLRKACIGYCEYEIQDDTKTPHTKRMYAECSFMKIKIDLYEKFNKTISQSESNIQ